MKVTIDGTEKEIADLVYLLQCQREMKRKLFSDTAELTPVIPMTVSSKSDNESKPN